METVKWAVTSADIAHMIISDDEARKVARSIREHCLPSDGCAPSPVPDDLLEAARTAVSAAPELRTDRIEHARSYLDRGEMDSRAVAEKMMSRIMSDWMR